MDTVTIDNSFGSEFSNLSVKDLIEKLCELAAWYRTYRGDPEKQAPLVAEYKKIFEYLDERGDTGLLDFECMLPDEYLPESFVKKLGFSKE